MAFNDRSILVLEDEPAVLALVVATLKAGNYEDVLTATTIQEARELWLKYSGRFDLVLTDFSLPDGSTPEFISELIAFKPELQIVVMSGLPDDALGLDPFSRNVQTLSKPFRPSELLSFLRQNFATAALA